MFTGIITEVGRLRAAKPKGPSLSLDVACGYKSLALGESICVDGVCLTVVSVATGDAGFTADVSAESLARTTLGSLGQGARVNLERALAVGDRLGGHIVSGHVDAVGRVAAREPVGDAERWTFEAPGDVLRFVAAKGSIAVSGVSLTVNAVGPTSFEVMLVPFTLGATTFGDKRTGTPVNLEVDVLARYVVRALEVARGAEGGGVTEDLLARAGFIRGT
jgi:riboflavin synthase